MFPQISPGGRTNPGVTVDVAVELGGVGLLPSAFLVQCDIWSDRIRNLDPCKELLSMLRNNTCTARSRLFVMKWRHLLVQVLLTSDFSFRSSPIINRPIIASVSVFFLSLM